MSNPEIQLNPQPEPPGTPEMSTAQTLTSIFFEPAETFKALKVRPRFLIAGIITVLLFTTYYATFVWRVGSETIARAQIQSRTPDATPEQIEQGLAMQNSTIVKAVTYAFFPLLFAVIFAAGAGLYMLATMLMGKPLSYKQALSVWVYSSYPPMVVFALLNILLLFLKSADDIDPTALNNGLARANLSILVDPKTQPLLATTLGSFDLITFYGLFLGAVGLKTVAKLSSGSVWGIMLVMWILGFIVRIVMSLIMGQAF